MKYIVAAADPRFIFFAQDVVLGRKRSLDLNLVSSLGVQPSEKELFR